MPRTAAVTANVWSTDRERRRFAARHKKRRRVAAECAEGRKPGAVDHRQEKCHEARGGEQHEGGGGADEAVERIRGVDGRKKRNAARSGQDRGYVGLRQDGKLERPVAAPQPFAPAEEHCGEQEAGGDPCARAEQARLDRVADEEDRAERQRQPADQHGPARSDFQFQRFAGWCRGGRRRRFRGKSFGGLLRQLWSSGLRWF